MHIKPKKRLGQNFLIDQNIQAKIINTCELKPSDSILEIGAGRGELTRLIADQVKRVYALEIDRFLGEILRDNLEGHANVEIIHQDILKFNLKRYFRKIKKKIKVIGNIPFYITTPIIEHLLRYLDKIDTVFLTVQKEFASRIIALPGCKDYGSFSCFIQYYTIPKIAFSIKKSCFLPAPKVDSCFLRLDIRQKLTLSKKKEEFLFKIIRSAFNQRRKTLRNSLKEVISKKKLELFFNQYGIDSSVRPEALSLDDFENLVKILDN